VNGGGPGALARSWIVRKDGTTETIQSKVVTRLAPGDKVVIETAGGGGYGPLRNATRKLSKRMC